MEQNGNLSLRLGFLAAHLVRPYEWIVEISVFTSPIDGWAVGFPGILVATIFHWDGFAWRHVSLSPALLGEIPPILSSVYMTGEENGWIVGASPDFNCYDSVNPPLHFLEW